MTKTLGEWAEQFRAMAVGASPGYALAMTDAAAMLDRAAHEPRVCASRDADHCDYPDCEQHWTLVIDWALAAMKKLHESAEPDTDHPEIPAIIPAAAFRAFVDEHARLMRIRASAPQGASRDASSACPSVHDHMWSGNGPEAYCLRCRTVRTSE